MSVFRIEKTKDYTVMSNYHLKDKNLSLKAKGLLSIMLSLPEDWDYSVLGLVAICKESKTIIQSTLKELEENKYLVRKRVQNSKGQFDYEYHIYEKPHNSNQQTEKPCTEKPCTENVPQLNTNILNTKKLNTNNIYTYAQNFEKFYSEYPKKASKYKVLEWFKKNKPDDELMNKIMTSLEKFKNSKDWKKDNGQFIPYPSTWLNQKRWEDEFENEIVDNSNEEGFSWEESFLKKGG